MRMGRDNKPARVGGKDDGTRVAGKRADESIQGRLTCARVRVPVW